MQPPVVNPQSAANPASAEVSTMIRLLPALVPLSAAFVVGHISGSLGTYALLVLTGHAPTWFGPELRDWSALFWSQPALELIAQLDNDKRFSKHAFRSSSRNYVQVGEPDSPRRVRRVMYFSKELMTLKGVVRFGSDTEGFAFC